MAVRLAVGLLILGLAAGCRGASNLDAAIRDPGTVPPGIQVLLTPPFEPGKSVLTGSAPVRREVWDPVEGKPVPVFSLSAPDGAALSSEELAGMALAINFWASWCGPCRHEIPLLVERQAELPEDLLVLAVNLREAETKIAEFASEVAMELPIVLDPDGEVADLFGVRGLPTTIFVDPQGNLTATWQGVLDRAKLVQLTDTSLGR
ncbi:MAG: TlpA family protein disulfide reductase [Caldilineaceae bacterium SB0661_bin_34]|nr:TlpA family protein disulfide reductase [Caldilineaceae bacterium SB0661_bin_34]